MEFEIPPVVPVVWLPRPLLPVRPDEVLWVPVRPDEVLLYPVPVVWLPVRPEEVLWPTPPVVPYCLDWSESTLGSSLLAKLF